MGKRGGTKKAPNLPPGSRNPISLREEITGKKQTKAGPSNPKSLLKLEHLQKLAGWASGEASIPSLGAFFGHRLATVGEAMGIPPDPSLFSCQRCETILQPGFNCTVRIEKSRAKARHRRKKPNNLTQNNVVYKCHFCSHVNLKRGTPKGYIKEICPSKAKTSSKSKPAKSKLQKSARLEKETGGKDDINKTDELASPAIAREISTTDGPAKSMLQKSARLEKETGGKDDINKTDELASPAIAREISTTDGPATPLVRTCTTLLEAKQRKRNRSATKKPAEPESNSIPKDVDSTVSTSNKRRRKSWTSLKEIAENNQHDSSRNIANLTIPFFI